MISTYVLCLCFSYVREREAVLTSNDFFILRKHVHQGAAQQPFKCITQNSPPAPSFVYNPIILRSYDHMIIKSKLETGSGTTLMKAR